MPNFFSFSAIFHLKIKKYSMLFFIFLFLLQCKTAKQKSLQTQSVIEKSAATSALKSGQNTPCMALDLTASTPLAVDPFALAAPLVSTTENFFLGTQKILKIDLKMDPNADNAYYVLCLKSQKSLCVEGISIDGIVYEPRLDEGNYSLKVRSCVWEDRASDTAQRSSGRLQEVLITSTIFNRKKLFCGKEFSKGISQEKNPNDRMRKALLARHDAEITFHQKAYEFVDFIESNYKSYPLSPDIIAQIQGVLFARDLFHIEILSSDFDVYTKLGASLESKTSEGLQLTEEKDSGGCPDEDKIKDQISRKISTEITAEIDTTSDTDSENLSEKSNSLVSKPGDINPSANEEFGSQDLKDGSESVVTSTSSTGAKIFGISLIALGGGVVALSGYAAYKWTNSLQRFASLRSSYIEMAEIEAKDAEKLGLDLNSKIGLFSKEPLWQKMALGSKSDPKPFIDFINQQAKEQLGVSKEFVSIDKNGRIAVTSEAKEFFEKGVVEDIKSGEQASEKVTKEAAAKTKKFLDNATKNLNLKGSLRLLNTPPRNITLAIGAGVIAGVAAMGIGSSQVLSLNSSDDLEKFFEVIQPEAEELIQHRNKVLAHNREIDSLLK